MEANYFTILYWFCHTSTWICHGVIRVRHPEPPSHLPHHTIPLGHPSAPAPSILYPASNLDWQFISYMILYMFQCHSPKSSHLLPLPQSPKDCSIHLYFFCWLAYRVIVIIFLNSIYMRSKRKDDLTFIQHVKICTVLLTSHYLSPFEPKEVGFIFTSWELKHCLHCPDSLNCKCPPLATVF